MADRRTAPAPFFGGGILGPPIGPQGLGGGLNASAVGCGAYDAPFTAPGVIRTGYYLGTPILVVKDAGDGWVIGLWPDKENPGRSHGQPRPFTYRKLEWWKLRDSQVAVGSPDVTLPDFPVTLAPKPVPNG